LENDYILTLNNDLILDPKHLEKMNKWAKLFHRIILTSVTYDLQSPKEIHYTGSKINWLTTKDVPLRTKKIKPVGGIAKITHAPGRGTLIPISVFKEIGLFDDRTFPHYAADFDFTLRAAKVGYNIYINYDAIIYSYVKETGLKLEHKYELTRLFDYFTNIKSPANIFYRFKLALRHCPKPLLPIYLIIDNIFYLGSFFKNWTRTQIKRRKE
jgi:GT2 family glycosyltransferase